MTDRKIVDYEIVTGGYRSLAHAVRLSLKKGYVLFGNIIGENGVLFQPMVKYEENDKVEAKNINNQTPYIKFINTNIDNQIIGLSTRTINALKGENIYFIKDLLKIRDFRKVQNIGFNSSQEIFLLSISYLIKLISGIEDIK